MRRSNKSMAHIFSEDKHNHTIKKGASSDQITAKKYLGYVSEAEVAWRTTKKLFLSTFHPPSNLILYSFQRLSHPKHLNLNSFGLTAYGCTNQKGLDFCKLLSTFQCSTTDDLPPVKLKASNWLLSQPSKHVSNSIQKKTSLLI